jgi:hypothetical protein
MHDAALKNKNVRLRMKVLDVICDLSGSNISHKRHDFRKNNPLTPELNPSAQRCLTRFYTGDFAS